MKRIALALLLSAATLQAQTAAPTPDLVQTHPVTREQLHELFLVTHSLDNAHKMMRQMVDGMQATSAPYMPKPFWDDFRTAMDTFDLETAMAPAYQKYFSEDDMKQVLAFYKSSIGQRFLDAQPLIAAAAGAELQKTGNEIGRKVAERHAEEIKAAKKKYDDEILSHQAPSANPN